MSSETLNLFFERVNLLFLLKTPLQIILYEINSAFSSISPLTAIPFAQNNSPALPLLSKFPPSINPKISPYFSLGEKYLETFEIILDDALFHNINLGIEYKNCIVSEFTFIFPIDSIKSSEFINLHLLHSLLKKFNKQLFNSSILEVLEIKPSK